MLFLWVLYREDTGFKKKDWLRSWFSDFWIFDFCMEKKINKESRGIWWPECLGSVPRTNSGRPGDTWNIWVDLCGNSNSGGRMSAGQTGHTTGQMGNIHGTDGTHTRGCPAKILYVCWFFSLPILSLGQKTFTRTLVGNVLETPTPTTCLKRTAICTAVRPPFVSPYFPGF